VADQRAVPQPRAVTARLSREDGDHARVVELAAHPIALEIQRCNAYIDPRIA